MGSVWLIVDTLLAGFFSVLLLFKDSDYKLYTWARFRTFFPRAVAGITVFDVLYTLGLWVASEGG